MKLSEINLNDLDFNNIGNWPIPAKAAAIAVICLALIVVGYFLDTQTQFDDLESAKQKEKDLKQLIEIKAAKAANLHAYKQQMGEIEKTFGSLLKQLPSKTEVAELLNDISQTGSTSGLEFELFKPQAEIPAEFYAELPIQLKVRGQYHELGKFMGGLASLPRIVTMHDFTISAPKKDSKSADLIMEATAKTYRYLDDKEIKQLKLSGK